MSGRLTTTYATDEDIAIQAASDFSVLCPAWQSLATGTDGVITGWTLASVTATFSANGVKSSNVILLRKPISAFPGQGEILAIESVSTNSVVMRRLGSSAGEGQAPPTVSGVSFSILTLGPQIEAASFDLNRRFAIDPNVVGRHPEDVYDLRDMRLACILTVLRWRYAIEARSADSDFAMKLRMLNEELPEVLGRLRLRWGPSGEAQTPTSVFTTRIMR